MVCATLHVAGAEALIVIFALQVVVDAMLPVLGPDPDGAITVAAKLSGIDTLMVVPGAPLKLVVPLCRKLPLVVLAGMVPVEVVVQVSTLAPGEEADTKVNNGFGLTTHVVEVPVPPKVQSGGPALLKFTLPLRIAIFGELALMLPVALQSTGIFV